jgi:hypothetical protein
VTLKQMVAFVRQVAQRALARGQPFDAGIMMQRDDGGIAIMMLPLIASKDEAEVAEHISGFLEENGITHYVYMSKMTRSTKNLYIYAAGRDGDRLTQRLEVNKGQLTEHPHEGVHRFQELFPRTLH